MGRALTENRLQFLLVFFFLGLTIVIGGLAGFLFEANENEQIQTLADAFWWAIVTLTTVGYGDIVPITTMGRLVGSTLMLAGMMNLGLFAAIVGVTLPKALMQVRGEQALLSSHLNHWVVCGFEPGAEMFLSLLDEDLDENTTVLSSVLANAQKAYQSVSFGSKRPSKSKINFTKYVCRMLQVSS